MRLKKMLGVFCLTFLFLFTGCGNKVSISATDFKNIMEDKGYAVQDGTSQFSEYDYVNQVYIAINSDTSYQIEFYELTDNDSAVSFFNTNKTLFENSKSLSSTETSYSMGNNDKYTLTTNGKYKVVSRIDNTVIYLDVDESNKSTIKDLLKDLGY